MEPQITGKTEYPPFAQQLFEPGLRGVWLKGKLNGSSAHGGANSPENSGGEQEAALRRWQGSMPRFNSREQCQ